MPKLAAKPKARAAPSPDAPPPSYDVEFGIRWHPQMPQFNRRCIAARWNRGTVSQFEHRKAIMEKLWPPDPNVYEMNDWSERRIKSLCENVFSIWLGPGGVGKTRDAAAFAVEYWLEDPGNTAVIVCSTTKEMLRKRIWCDICTLWTAIQGTDYKGVLTDTNCMIRWKDNDMKNGIYGIAVDDGPVQEAINNIVGIHTSRYLLIIDELQGVKDAIMDDSVLANIASNPEVKVLGMGNPTSLNSLLCKMGTPVGGWGSVERGVTPEWDINKGPFIGNAKCLFFDGRKSPAVLNPEWGKKRPWMKQKAQVDAHIASKGEDDPSVWTMTIGWPPPLGTENTILDISIVEKFRCRERAYWTSGFTEGAALDPAFAEGGDNKVLQFFRYGLVNDDEGSRWVIEFREWLEVPIDTQRANTGEETIEYQIVSYCKEKCRSKGIKPQEFGLDMTGIGRGLCMIFRKEWGPVIGVEFGGGASDEPVEEAGKTAREVFDRRSSELNIMLRNFANANGIRGLPKKAEEEACMRLTTHKGKHRVETKADMKKRLRKSPDNLDACCIAIDIARQNGAVPGASGPAVLVNAITAERAKRDSDEMFAEQVVEDDWSVFAM